MSSAPDVGHSKVNASTPFGLTSLPTNLLEALLPGYSLLTRLVLDVLGLDASVVVSLAITIWSLTTAAGYVYRKVSAQVEAYFTASVIIDANDDLHEHVISWISKHRVSKSTRTLKARDNQVGAAWDDYSMDNAAFVDSAFDAANDDILINLSNWESKIPPVFEPYRTSKWFWHRGHLFRFQRDKFSVLDDRLPKGPAYVDDEQVTITVLGRSTQPIKDLISEARELYFSKKAKKTRVRRPAPKFMKGGGRSASWMQIAVRPSRPIETIVLSHAEKQRLLADINDYLQPATRIWYANRGIPYRRGYLFHGPPGTGKTSLSFAIAGIFGLDIFSLSLLDPGLTEEDLGILFSNLPRHCVVLLEDIDSAGLTRGPEQSEPAAVSAQDDSLSVVNDPPGLGPSPVRNHPGGSSTTPAAPRRRRLPPADPVDDVSRGISLSGLLNAIDGVASHEGRILVMTTNHPDKLDPALLRPGRVDMMVGFTLATREQIKELFLRMYTDIRLQTPQRNEENHSLQGLDGPLSREHTARANLHAETIKNNNKPSGASDSAGVDAMDLEPLAAAFAAVLPDSMLSPAEVQGFLLTRKKEPQRAVREVAAWRDGLLRAKQAQREGIGMFASAPDEAQPYYQPD